MSKKNKFHLCSQCGDNIAHWYSDKFHHNHYCDDCFKDIRGVDNIRNLDDFGEPLVGSHVMWWSIDSIASDFRNSGLLEREKNSFYYTYLDEEFNRVHSKDFIYSPIGFSLIDDSPINYVCYDDIVSCFNEFSIKYLDSKEIFKLKNILGEIYFRYRIGENMCYIEYNKLMSQFGSYIHYRNCMMFNCDNTLHKFFTNYRNELKKCCINYLKR